METIVARENMLQAMLAVERNAGAAGVDGMTTEQLRGHPLERASAAEQQVNGFLTEVPVIGWMDLWHICSSFFVDCALPVHQIGGTSVSSSQGTAMFFRPA